MGDGDGPDRTMLLGTVTLPGTRRSVARARTFVRDAAPPGLPALDDLVIVTSETVANAVAHTASGRAGGLVTVVLAAAPGRCRLEVADDGAGGRRPRVRAGADGHGRGLRIVQALAVRWGYRADGRGTVVWAEFPAPAAWTGAGTGGRGRGPVSGPG